MATDANFGTVFTGTRLDAIRHLSATGAGIAILTEIYALSDASRVALIWRPTSPMADSFQQIATTLTEDALTDLQNDLD